MSYYSGAAIEPFVPPMEKCRPGRSSGLCAACKQYGLATPETRRAFDRQRISPFVQCVVKSEYGRGDVVPEYLLAQHSGGLRDLWRKDCLEILQRVRESDRHKFFWAPVDKGKYLPHVVDDYYRIIVHPSNLDKVRKELESGQIGTPDEFVAEMRAIFINCFTYNRPHPALGEKDPYHVGKMIGVNRQQRGLQPAEPTDSPSNRRQKRSS